ncbi:MAG TPA: adenosine kinase [Rhodospirillaceae bacterium]|nr:adenosine kinase [Magnetovibrio sp.]HBT43987.1 adenosine kinase [Rhodospirillaceae bacterium]|tara:strand:- start:6042 stop:7037 length:996 start_codon:yes stop_codon:yes gene_type:complete
MTNPRFDVAGIGNAIVDVLTQTDDAFLEREGLAKGAMTLVDEAQAAAVYDKAGPAMECSGGSAANTIAVMARLGAKCAFMGKVKDDAFGRIFGHDIRSLGVHFDTAAAADGPATANCLVLVTPDAQRTMLTYLGASIHLKPADVDLGVIKDARVTYLEGYLWDPEDAKQAFRTAAAAARDAGREVALSLSDPFCVDRHRADFLDLIEGHVDILFANEAEILSLYQVDDFDAAVDKVKGHCKIAALTRSEKGSVVVSGDNVTAVAATPVDKVIDTTGAGDAYAAGFLYGYTRDEDLAACARMGGIAAAEVIAQIGARPETDIKAAMTLKLRD